MSYTRVPFVLFVLCGLAALGAAPMAAAPPAEDDCASPHEIPSLPYEVTVPMFEATPEASDLTPLCAPGAERETVWFSFASASGEQVRLDTTGSTTDTIITVATGDCGDLQAIDCDTNSGLNGEFSHGLVDFYAEAGVSYRIQISTVFERPDASVLLSASAGQSHPVTVVVRDAVDSTPLAGAHVQVRDTAGGYYKIREGWTDAAGSITLHPESAWDYDIEIMATGHVAHSEIVDLSAGPLTLDVALDRMGPIPAVAEEPTRIAIAGWGGIAHFLPDGTDQRWIDLPDDFSWIAYAAWSPDGTQIAFEGRRLSWNYYEIWIVDIDGTNLRRLTTLEGGTPGRAEHLDWSPDGSRIAFSVGSIYTVDTATGLDVQLLSAEGWAPNWSPDGSMIAYDDAWGARVMRPDGSDMITMTDLVGNIDWSPDGQRFVTAQSYNAVVTATVEDQEISLLAEPTTNGVYNAVWSPGGQDILFMDDWLTVWFPTLVGADGTGRRAARRDPASGAVPDWARRHGFDVPADLAPRARVLSPNGGEVVDIGSTFTIAWEASDDKGIASQDLYLVRDLFDDGQEAIPIATGLPGDARSFDWSVPDDYDTWHIRVVARDTAGQDVHAHSAYPFTIADRNRINPWYEVSITYPSGGEVFSTGETITITWDAATNFTPPEAQLEISYDGGLTWRDYIEPFVPRDATSWDWTVPDVVTDEAVIRILKGTWSLSRSFHINSSPAPSPLVANVQMGRGPGATTFLSWPASSGAVSYDVIRGDLSAVEPMAGRIDLGPVDCLADDLASTGIEIEDAARPEPGRILYYLVRPNLASGPGLYGESPDGRDHLPSSGDCSD